MANSTDIIAYSDGHGGLICLPCVREANKAFAEDTTWPPIEDSDEFSPYFESDRQGDECCDVCYSGEAI